MLPLIRGTGMLTLGSQQRNIDFEPEWRRKMHVFLDPAHASKKAKGSFQHPTNLYWPCLCLSSGTRLVHSSVVQPSLQMQKCWAQSRLLCCVLWGSLFMTCSHLPSRGEKNQGKITCFEHCKCSSCNMMQPCREVSNIGNC